jgi:hypothetical protein
VLGIEEAHEDPTLSSGGNSAASASSSGGEGGATPKGGAGGSGTTSGGAGATSSGASSGTTNSGGMMSGGSDAGGEGGSAGSSGGAGGSSGDGGDSGAAGAGGAGGPSLCDQYCDTVTELCTGTMLQYKDKAQCLKVCALLPEGAVGDPDGNSVACRLKYASKGRYAAGSELAAYCRQAGAGGDGRCGGNCDGFCSIAMATCSKAETDPFYFATEQACQTTCQGLPNDIPYVYGDISVADGNSVQCRLFHAMSAVMADAGEHCEHVMGLTLCEAL